MSEQTGITKALWLQMLTEGGYSSTRELARSVNAGDKRIDRVLDQLADGGYCLKVANTETHKKGVAFGVTPACKVPQNVAVREILAAVKGAQ